MIPVESLSLFERRPATGLLCRPPGLPNTLADPGSIVLTMIPCLGCMSLMILHFSYHSGPGGVQWWTSNPVPVRLSFLLSPSRHSLPLANVYNVD